ncbi:ubiquitin-specific protease ubp1 [Marasmius crinis-equi]|uniref:Ubiquitin-specific protease ubp1 n=1 Tax=Marasmius crinis-equi TaxID=585013 RepID=A0ABR3EZG2_9AGAR
MIAPAGLVCFFAAAVVAAQTTLRGSFALPKTGVKWRYWIQDATTDPGVLRFDAAEMARVGSAGFEFLSYQSYGGVQGATGRTIIDPTDVAFGSDLFVNTTKMAVEAAILHNLTIDFTLGPAQGAGVPVYPPDVDKEGLLTELVVGSHYVQSGDSFSGPLPPPNVKPFVANDGTIRSANTTNHTLVAVIGARVADGSDITANRVTLDVDTVVDLSAEAESSGNTTTISWTPPDSTGVHVLLAYYYRRNGFPEAIGGFNGAQIDKPGSWGAFVVDHFSRKGVEVSSRFIQENILSREGIGELLAQPGVGKYMWEDSVEFQGQVWWTDTFAERFSERHGYSVNRVLPILHTLGRGRGSALNQTFQFASSARNTSLAYLEDYRDTTTTLYVEYMSAFNEWSHSVGMEFSHQPAYGFDLDIAASAAIPDVPEIESLALPLIDEARQLSGGVHLGGHTLFSSEIGARVHSTFALSMGQLLQDCKSQYAAGVNIALLHGYPYSGSYPQTTWPGLVTFAYTFGEMHGPRMPAWDHYKEYLDFLARNQYILQAGVAKVDIAIYRKDYGMDPTPPFRDTSLATVGYTYEYISPENLRLPGVSVTDRRLASDGPSYKALILNRVQNTTVDAARRMLQYAQDGLPIVLNTLVPNGIPGLDINGSRSAEVRDLMAQLLSLPSVKIVQDEPSVADALRSLGVVPSVQTDPPSPSLYTVRRDESPEIRHFYLYNQGTASVNFTLTLTPEVQGSTRYPYNLDPWTGRVNPVGVWNDTADGGVVIPSVSLAPNQSALFSVTKEALLEGVSSPLFHISGADPDVFASIIHDGTIEVRSFIEGERSIALSDGRLAIVDIALEGETPRELSDWQLNITKWEAPEDLSQVNSVLVPQSPINLSRLVPWDELEGHMNTSGVGTYITTFEWNHSPNSSVGVMLDFGVVVHTLKAWLNGAQIATVDPTHPVTDVSEIVREGSNTLRVDAASTLLNAVNAVLGVETLGQLRADTERTFPANQHYGLVAPIRLIPYGRVVLPSSSSPPPLLQEKRMTRVRV